MLPHEIELKEALHASVFESEKPAKAIASESGLEYGALQKFCANSEPSHLPLRRVPLVVKAIGPTGNHAFLDMLEGLAGRVAFRLPDAKGAGKQTACLLREFSEFLDSLSDDDSSPETVARVEREGADVLRAVAAIVEQRRRTAAPGLPGPRAVGEK